MSWKFCWISSNESLKNINFKYLPILHCTRRHSVHSYLYFSWKLVYLFYVLLSRLCGSLQFQHLRRPDDETKVRNALKKCHMWWVNSSKLLPLELSAQIFHFFCLRNFCRSVSSDGYSSKSSYCTWHCIFSCVHFWRIWEEHILSTVFLSTTKLTTLHLPKGVKFYKRRFTRETWKNADVSYDCYLLLVEERYAF